MSKTYNVAVVGATGAVGQSLIEILEQRNFPVGELFPLASSRSAGSTVKFNNRQVRVQDLETFDFSQVQIGLFSAGGAISRVYAPKAAEAGCVVVDNTSEFRYQDNIPLVVPEVNESAIAQYKETNIIANPNCSTIQMLVALKPIYDRYGIDTINVATYQSVSGSGKAGIDELAGQTAKLLNGLGAEPKVFSQQIAFNVIPHIDVLQDNGFTKEEMKMVWETQKIFDDPAIKVNPTAVRVPVFYGHSEAVHIITKNDFELHDVINEFKKAKGVEVVHEDDPFDYASAVKHATGEDPVFVSRIRRGLDSPRSLNLWVVSDNIRKGAALNSVQIAEKLIESYL
jgi:aspartate-semialdehyde dehydrogenase